MKILHAISTMQVFLSLVFLLTILIILCESIWPAYARRQSVTIRWLSHGALHAVNSFLGRELYPLIAMLMLSLNLPDGFGWFARVDWPFAVVFLLSVFALDLWQYLLHRLKHSIPWLWRFHQIHHSDQDFDVTTSFRFHPLEVMLGMLWRVPVITLLGVPWEALVLHAVLNSVVDLVSHANLSLKPALDHTLRRVLVTPYMHRTHHALNYSDSNTNFGTIFSLWDRVLGTHRAEATEGRMTFRVGVENLNADVKAVGFWWMLHTPFARKNKKY